MATIMGKLDREELANILARHERYLENPLGEGGESVYFCGIELYGCDFRGMNLTNVVFVDCNLTHADFSKTKSVNVRFINCTMNGCSFDNSDLCALTFIRTSLVHAAFHGTTCRCCMFFACDFYDACIVEAQFLDTEFFESGLDHLSIDDRCILINVPLACPDTGSFIAWKKAGHTKKFIVKLLIPEDALRSSATKAKCRCNKAKVLAIENLDGTDSGLTRIRSNYDESFIYEVGKTVQVDNFDTNRLNECAPGIHFFVDRQTAVKY